MAIYGVNVDGDRIFSNFRYLTEDLETIDRMGFDFAEISISGLEIMSNAQLIPEKVRKVKEILNYFNLQYCFHAPDSLNLASLINPDMEVSIVKVIVDFMEEVSSKLLVIHSGYISYSITSGHLPVERARKTFLDCLKECGSYTQVKGITLCVENLPVKVDRFCLGDRIDRLCSIVDEVGMKNVKIAFDFGHALSSCNYFNLKFLEELKKAVDYIQHIHIHDTHGKGVRGLSNEPLKERIVQGTCHHLPLGWGKVPYVEGLQLLKKNNALTITLELYPRYRDYYKKNLEKLKYIMEDAISPDQQILNRKGKIISKKTQKILRKGGER